MNEVIQKFWFWLMLLMSLLIIPVVALTCEIQQNYYINKLVENGATPIEAKAAITTSYGVERLALEMMNHSKGE